MSDNKNKRSLRNANLAVTPAGIINENKKAEAVNNGMDINDKSLEAGRDGYAFKAQQSGDYRKIGAVIKKYRSQYPDSSFLDVYEVLHSRFPWIFEKERKDVYSGNVAKFIKNDRLWRNCYFANKDELVTLAEVRITEILEKDNIDDKTVISAYDKLKKYELLEKELQQTVKKEGSGSTNFEVLLDSEQLDNELNDAIKKAGG